MLFIPFIFMPAFPLRRFAAAAAETWIPHGREYLTVVNTSRKKRQYLTVVNTSRGKREYLTVNGNFR